MMIWGLQLLLASYQPYIHLTEFRLVVPYQKLRNGCEHLQRPSLLLFSIQWLVWRSLLEDGPDLLMPLPSAYQSEARAVHRFESVIHYFHHFGVDLPHRFVVESQNYAENFHCHYLVVSKPLQMSKYNYFWHYII